jgi:hypothetical protein
MKVKTTAKQTCEAIETACRRRMATSVPIQLSRRTGCKTSRGHNYCQQTFAPGKSIQDQL